MQRLEVSGAVRPIYGSLGVKRLINICIVALTFILKIVYLVALRDAFSKVQEREDADGWFLASCALSDMFSCSVC